MSRRRLALALAAVALLVVGIFAAPFEASVAEESLERTAVGSSPIAGAIDSGTAPTISSLLPTSEAYQRATQLVDGLKAGIPSAAPVATAAQLDDITAFSRGALQGALTDPTSLTTSEERQKIKAFATGYLSGALTQIASAPTAGRSAADEAIAKGVFAGVTSAILGPQPVISASDLEAYGRTLAAETFDELDRNGELLAGLSGSPALSDITLFATGLSREQVEATPTSVARTQLDAIASFGAGTLDGMVVGVVTGFPQGVPAPSEEDLRRWFEMIGSGHAGTAPWNEPSSLPLLLAWADASAAAAVLAVDDARERATGSSPTTTLDEMGAWALGVAHGAYDRLDALATAAPGVEKDVRAYAEGVTGPGIAYILTRPHPALSPALVTAYAEGLAGGADDLRGSTVRALGLTETFLEDLASGVTRLPSSASPAQSATMEAYLDGVTDRLTQRMDGVASLVSGDDPKLLAAMAEGLAQGAVGIAGGPALTRPELGAALGAGFVTGFLDSRNPRVLAEGAVGLTEAAKSWTSSAPPVSLVYINDLVQSTGRDPYNAVQQYATTMGRAPVTWAENKGLGGVDQGFGGADDLLWIASFTNASVPIIFEEIKEALTSADPQRTLDGVNAYAANVTGNLSSLNLTHAIDNLTSRDHRAHARRFAEYALTPLDWVASKEEQAAAREVLRATLANARDIERFREADYSQAALAFLKATSDGIKDGRPKPGEVVHEIRQGYLPAWTGGVAEAIAQMPADEVRGDISDRVQWFKAAAQVVRPIAREATADQIRATKAFATQTGAWVIRTPERIPEAGEVDLPLVTFLNATLHGTLAQLPPAITPEEEDAILAYAAGIQMAVEALPPRPDPLSWGLPDQLAMDAYVGGIVSGIGLVKNETALFLCTYNVNVTGCPPKATDADPDPDPDPDPTPPKCDDFECQFDNWTENLQTWALNLTAGGILEMDEPDTQPTRTGIAFVSRWAAEVLAGHGYCPDFESATLECDGPRGPVREFAQARNDSIAAFADAISTGYAGFIDLSDPPHGLTRPLTDPILAWAAGVQNAAGTGFLQPGRLLPSESPGAPGAPVGAPPQDPSDPSYREELKAWTQSVITAPGRVYDSLWVPFPDTTGWNATVADIDYLFGHVIWEGGYDALNQSETNLSKMAVNAIPNAALDAIALGLVNATRDVVLLPAAHDLELLLGWYQGVAEGGVEAVLEGATTIKEQQLPAIAAYAESVAKSYGPPAAPKDALLREVFPPDEPGGNETGDNETGTPPPPRGPSPREVYMQNMQAHAAGLAEAILNAPLKPLAHNATTYGAHYLSYVHAIANATQDLPPVSPDAGFPARLTAWTHAQAERATRLPTSADRLGPDPDEAMATALVGSFAGASPWNLPPDAERKLDWARAAVEGGAAAACPSVDASRCAIVGALIGDALGIALPQQAPASPVPYAQQLALVTGIVEGAAKGLVEGTPAAGALGIVAGITAGLVPEGATEPDVGEIAGAAAAALAPVSSHVPATWLEPAARELTGTLLSADPARYQALANGTAALLLGLAASGQTDPIAMERSLRAFLAADGKSEPSVTVGDGERTYANAQLAPASAPAVDGLRDVRVSVLAPASSPTQARWELAWSATDPRGASAQRMPLAGSNGALTATFAPAALASLARGAVVRFVVIETSATGTRTFPAESSYAFRPDRDAPTVTLSAPATAERASFTVSWSGTDGDTRVATYRVEVREGSAAWREWLRATDGTSAAFSGVAGATYAFRATATDAVGHASATSAPVTTAVPAGAPSNQAPTIAILAPSADSAHGRSVAAKLALADPDGTTPTVRLCFRAPGSTSDVSCAYEGSQTALTLDAAALPEGRYVLHATATDGTLFAQATSAPFTLDRAPPAFRGANAEASAARVLLSAALDADATGVAVEVAGRSVPLVPTAPGVWAGEIALAPGEHALTFRATDPAGNEATLERTIVVRAPSPRSGSSGAGAGSPAEAPTSVPPSAAPPGDDEKGAPAPALALVLVALAAVALARRRR